MLGWSHRRGTSRRRGVESRPGPAGRGRRVRPATQSWIASGPLHLVHGDLEVAGPFRRSCVPDLDEIVLADIRGRKASLRLDPSPASIRPAGSSRLPSRETSTDVPVVSTVQIPGA